MATFVSDSFTDTSGTALSSHTGETGATWTKHASYSTTLVISNANRVRTDGTASTITYYASGAPASADYSVSMVLRQFTGAGHLGVVGRVDTASNTLYRARFDGGGNVFHLQKLVAGTATLLGSYVHDMIDTEERTLKLVMQGDQISVEMDGSAIIGPLTDTGVTAAGKAGIYGFSTGSDSTGIHGDTFTAVDIGGGGGTTVNLGLATETETVFGLSLSKKRTLGLAVETDTVPGAITLSKKRTLGLATEVESAFAMTVTGGAAPRRAGSGRDRRHAGQRQQVDEPLTTRYTCENRKRLGLTNGQCRRGV